VCRTQCCLNEQGHILSRVRPTDGCSVASKAAQKRAGDVPLVVDLDHTLVCGDVAIEAMVRVARRGIVALIVLMLVCLRGRAMKTFLARYTPVDPATLTYNKSVLTLIGARRSGRPVILATAAHWRTARRVAAHLGLFDHIIASSSRANLKGTAKLEAIYALLGKETFDYVGFERRPSHLEGGADRFYGECVLPVPSWRSAWHRAEEPSVRCSKRFVCINGPRMLWCSSLL
jgi:hypothetical protein